MQKKHECKPSQLPMARVHTQLPAAVSRRQTTSLHNARPAAGRARNDTCEPNALGDRRGTRPQRASTRCVARKRDRTEKLAQNAIHLRRVRQARPLAKPWKPHAGLPAQPKRAQAADRVVRATAANPRLAPRRGREHLADKRLERPRGAR